MHPGIQSWKYFVVYAFHVFSTPLLLRTLFTPWKRDKIGESHLTVFEKMVFAVFSRILGFIARIIFIAIGILFTLFAVLTFPIFFFIPIKISREYFQTRESFGASLSYGSTFTLNAHGKDLISVRFLKLFGKEKVLRQIERGLSKETNHNILLIGETGTGKGTVVSFLGRLGHSGLSPYGIRNHRVVELSVEGINLIDFEKCFVEAEKAGNVILVIRNIHLYESLFEKMMKYLGAPDVGIVVTADLSGYDQVLKNHPDFLSKFEKINVDPTNFEDTLLILKNYLKVHGKGGNIKTEVLEEIVRLSERYIGNQSEPMKSILVLEELLTLKRKIKIEDVRQIISDKTNMPIGTIGMDEKRALIELETKMKNKIIGQEEAVRDVSQALKRLRTGIADPGKPAGSFLFLGPTGVGKTYTAKILAESYFGRKDAMIRFDMSEFSLPDSVNNFTNQLATIIEEMPLSLVFFDELEKSNRLIHNLLLQVLDEGRLTRPNGREVSFRDALIIATSNAGSVEIVSNSQIDKKTLLNNLIKDNIFTPEFLNRFSDVVLFKPLKGEEVKKIAELLLLEFSARLKADKNISIDITPSLVEKVASAGFDPEFGARPIHRAMEEIVENKVAESILKGDITEGIIKII